MFTQVAGEFRQNALVIIGTDTVDEEVKSMAVSNRPKDRGIFTGSRSDIQQFLEARDVLAIRSFAEYYTIDLLETIRVGEIVVATDVGGNMGSTRPKQGRTGLLSSNVPAIPDALNLLFLSSELCSATWV